MGTQKPRIIPWLISQINSKKYPGLVWLNEERTLFCIPWKHGLRQDRCEDDVKIFEAWALASGAYDPRKDKPNPAVWKRNFRSALNRKDGIKVMKDNSSDSTNPHKIYEVTNQISAESDTASEEPFQTNSISPCSELPYFNSPESNMSITMNRNLSEEMMQLQLSHNDEDLYLSPEDHQNEMGILETNIVPVAQENWYSAVTSPEAFAGSATPVYTELVTYTAQEEQDGADAAAFPAPEHGIMHQNPSDQFFHNNTLITDFEVDVYYRGTLVNKTLVKNPHGFCITSRNQPKPGSYLENVVLPWPSMVCDQLVASEICKLLQNLEEGTLVEVREGTICGRRQGKCRSYWSMTDTPHSNKPNQIDKNDYCVLYTLQQFVADLRAFMEGTRKESPEYSIWMCLGELWPDDKPWKKKLIMVQITPVALKYLHEMSYSTGASSLRSSEVNLQISDSLSLSSMPDLMSILKDLQEKMDCE
ncbi:interferon regulatory factor 3 [Rhinophrynus dorsalis]